MAFLLKVQVVAYVDEKSGRRVKKGTPGAVKTTGQSKKYYAGGVPGLGRRVPLAADRRVAQRMLDDLVRGVERGQANMPDASAGRRPLADHLAAFERDLRLGLASRNHKARRRPSDFQVAQTVQRVRDVLSGCGFSHPADLNDAAAARLAGYLDGRTALPRKDGGLSQQSAAFFLAAVRRFVWWLSVRARAPVRADLFDDVGGFDPKADRKHARREIAPDELARLLDATRTSPKDIRGLTGEDRYFLYLVAFSSGFRAGELAALAPENFDLDADQATVALPAKLTKNRKAARQPLPPGVAAQLRTYLRDRPIGSPVWPGSWREKPVKVLRGDLAAAGVPYVVTTPEGPRYADFHALRHSFVSALAAAGVGPKELQTLARHGDPRLTLGVYAHARPEALGAAVARLRLPGADDASLLSALSRDELEGLVVGLSAMLGTLLGPAPVCTLFALRFAPGRASGGDFVGRSGGGRVGRRSV